jgi:hypothetical protein
VLVKPHNAGNFTGSGKGDVMVLKLAAARAFSAALS